MYITNTYNFNGFFDDMLDDPASPYFVFKDLLGGGNANIYVHPYLGK